MTEISTRPSGTRWGSPSAPATRSGGWPRISADALTAVREPLAWRLDPGRRAEPTAVVDVIRAALAGPTDDAWQPPVWLLPHQVPAARRLAGSLAVFGGALLADAVGLGKTYVALALAARAGRATAVVPASLREQWRRVSRHAGVVIDVMTHEALSRGASLSDAPLVIVDEAHRFRNPGTKRYDALARGVRGAGVLLVSATPVVNRAADLLHILRLFLPDDALAVLGVASLERALEARDYGAVQRAAYPLMVARSARQVTWSARLPAPADHPVIVQPTLAPALFDRIVQALDVLRLPNVGDRHAAALLRLGLFARLASSAPALRESLRRHLGYLDAAAGAIRRREQLPRAAARRLLRDLGDLQLDLEIAEHVLNGSSADLDEVEQERDRILRLLELLPREPTDPKADALADLLGRRVSEKAIVFTGAIATARHLARRLAWNRVAVVGGGRAWIATGTLTVDRVLRLFAPRAQHAAPPGALHRVDRLVATDLVSEGLDLQDAAAVVHYDLPWTPLRLAQRVGRIARVGSPHARVSVSWFAPPPQLDRRLRIAERLVRKADDQMRLAVSATSTTGRAQTFNVALEARERLAAAGSRPRAPVHAFVRGNQSFAVVEWSWDGAAFPLPEAIVLEQDGECSPYDPVALERALGEAARSACVCTETASGVPKTLVEAVRRRLQAAARGPTDGATRRLRRAVLRRALDASQDRRACELAALDAVLSRLSDGVRQGALLELAPLITGSARALEQWADRWRPASRGLASVRLAALLAGVGP